MPTKKSFSKNFIGSVKNIKMPPYTEKIQLRSPSKSDQSSPGSSKLEPGSGMTALSKKSAPQFKVEVCQLTRIVELMCNCTAN